MRPLEDGFTLVLTGSAAAVCSLYKHSLTRPVYVLPWGWEVVLSDASCSPLQGRRRRCPLQELQFDRGQASLGPGGIAVQLQKDTSLIYKDGFVSFLELSNSFCAATVWSPVLEVLEML